MPANPQKQHKLKLLKVEEVFLQDAADLLTPRARSVIIHGTADIDTRETVSGENSVSSLWASEYGLRLFGSLMGVEL
jgi:hypothetical protein